MAVTLYDWTTATFSEEKKTEKFEKSNKWNMLV
jgi:hypothetical protein